MAGVKSKDPEKDLSEKTSGPLSWDRTDAMRCDGVAGVEETRMWWKGWMVRWKERGRG